jgi:hypothetical protein
MTREEAAREIDNTACCFSDKRFRDVMHMAADALRGPVPDPETGLVRCGCGGVAKLYHYDVDDAFRDAFPDDYWVVFCDDCGIETGTEPTEEQAKTVWNRAMGYRG